MKGGGAARRRSFFSTDSTLNSACSRSRRTAVAISSLGISCFLPFLPWYLAMKEGGFFPSSSTPIFQYSLGSKAEISRSLSTTSLKATDCTRPAESPRRTFFQRMGEIS